MDKKNMPKICLCKFWYKKLFTHYAISHCPSVDC